MKLKNIYMSALHHHTREQNKEKYKPQRLFAEHKARISMPKFGKFL